MDYRHHLAEKKPGHALAEAPGRNDAKSAIPLSTVLLKPLWDLNTQHIPVVKEP